MTAHVLISGRLFRAPESRVAKNGKSFVTATIKSGDGDAAEFWRVLAFGRVAEDHLEVLREGDALAPDYDDTIDF